MLKSSAWIQIGKEPKLGSITIITGGEEEYNHIDIHDGWKLHDFY